MDIVKYLKEKVNGDVLIKNDLTVVGNVNIDTAIGDTIDVISVSTDTLDVSGDAIFQSDVIALSDVAIDGVLDVTTLVNIEGSLGVVGRTLVNHLDVVGNLSVSETSNFQSVTGSDAVFSGLTVNGDVDVLGTTFVDEGHTVNGDLFGLGSLVMAGEMLGDEMTLDGQLRLFDSGMSTAFKSDATLHIKKDGSCSIWLDADADNLDETHLPRLVMSQDSSFGSFQIVTSDSNGVFFLNGNNTSNTNGRFIFQTGTNVKSGSGSMPTFVSTGSLLDISNTGIISFRKLKLVDQILEIEAPMPGDTNYSSHFSGGQFQGLTPANTSSGILGVHDGNLIFQNSVDFWVLNQDPSPSNTLLFYNFFGADSNITLSNSDPFVYVDTGEISLTDGLYDISFQSDFLCNFDAVGSGELHVELTLTTIEILPPPGIGLDVTDIVLHDFYYGDNETDTHGNRKWVNYTHRYDYTPSGNPTAHVFKIQFSGSVNDLIYYKKGSICVNQLRAD